MKTILLILFLSIPTLACGLPQPIYGKAPWMSYIIIETKGERIVHRPSTFGYFSVTVMPCSSYTVSVKHKLFNFEPVLVEPIDFEGKGVEVIFSPLSQ